MPVSASSTICNTRQSILILLGVVALITRGLLVEFEITNEIRRLFIDTNNSTIRYNNSTTTNITNKLAEQTNTSQKNNNTNHSIKIPKIVHQEWKSKELPYNFKLYREECIRLNPNWEFKLWTDEENLQLITNHYPQLLDLYNSYDVKIKKIDMIRYLYLHRYGGVYMDLDITCLQPFHNIFDNVDYYNKFIVVNQFENKREYANALMASSPGYELFDSIARGLHQNKNKNVLSATGGTFLQYSIIGRNDNKGKWVEMPFELFYAQDYTNKDKCNSFDNCRSKYPNAITISIWSNTWQSGSASDLQWQNSSSVPYDNISTDYNLSTDIMNKIFISGIVDRELCYECDWHPGMPCHKRMDYVFERYHHSLKKSILEMIKNLPQCRVANNVTTTNKGNMSLAS